MWPHCSVAISAEHRSKFVTLYRQWWLLHVSEKLSSWMKNPKQTKQNNNNDADVQRTNCDQESSLEPSAQASWKGHQNIFTYWPMIKPRYEYPLRNCSKCSPNSIKNKCQPLQGDKNYYLEPVRNQCIVSTEKRLASLLPWQLILYIILSMATNCMYMELEVQCTCMYDPNKCWFYTSKTYCFRFLLTLKCENLA